MLKPFIVLTSIVLRGCSGVVTCCFCMVFCCIQMRLLCHRYYLFSELRLSSFYDDTIAPGVIRPP